MTRTFGIEIEAYNANRDVVVSALQAEGLNARTSYYNATDANSWLVKTDASIHGHEGFEVVSPILTELTDVAKVCRALATVNAKVNKSTGLHVHVGASDLKIADWKNMVKRYRDNETTIDSFMPASRRGHTARYIGSITGLADYQIDRCSTLQQLATAMRTRYLKLNVESYVKHGTVEFRHHSGTVDYSKISKWVEFCLNFVESSKVKTKTTRIKPSMVIESVAYNPHGWSSDARDVYRCLNEGETVGLYFERVSALGLADAKKAQRELRGSIAAGRVTLEGYSTETSGADRGLWANQSQDVEIFYRNRAMELI